MYPSRLELVESPPALRDVVYETPDLGREAGYLSLLSEVPFRLSCVCQPQKLTVQVAIKEAPNTPRMVVSIKLKFLCCGCPYNPNPTTWGSMLGRRIVENYKPGSPNPCLFIACFGDCKCLGAFWGSIPPVGWARWPRSGLSGSGSLRCREGIHLHQELATWRIKQKGYCDVEAKIITSIIVSYI